MFLVESDGLLKGVVAQGVPVREVLGDDSRSGLVLL